MHTADPSRPRLRSSSYLYYYSYFPFINSIFRFPSFNYNIASWDKYLSYIDTHCPPSSSFKTFSLSEATYIFTKLFNDAAASVIPFGNINFSLLHSISGSSSSSPSDFPSVISCHTPVNCANQLSTYLQSHFSTQTPKPFCSTEKTHMNKIRSAQCNNLHSFSSLELSSAISQLSNSTFSNPDQIT